MSYGRLVLMRHAKSAYPVGVPDHDRPLSERGVGDVRAAREWFAGTGRAFLGEEPTVLVSSALRTQQSWEGIRSAIPSADVHQSPGIYEAAVSTLIDLCSGPVLSGRHTLVIGHNPGLELLGDFLADPDESVLSWREREKYPTSAILVLELKDESWANASARATAFVVPRGRLS